MTLEQLRIFVAVAEREHMTLGARDVFRTQSATSAAIAALEQRHGTQLFDRIGRRVALTEAGRVFLVEARAVLARAAAAEQVLTDIAGLNRGTLTIAASQTIANYWLPGRLHHFQARYPGITLKLTIGNTQGVAEDVHEGVVDLGFVEGEIDVAEVATEHIADDEMVLVVAPDHPWRVGLPDLTAGFKAARWVLREPGSGTRSIFEAALPSLGLCVGDLNVSLELPSNEAVRAAVEAGAGVTVMSRLVVAQSLAADGLVAFELPMPRRRFYAVRHRDRYFSRAGKAFLELLVGN